MRFNDQNLRHYKPSKDISDDYAGKFLLWISGIFMVIANAGQAILNHPASGLCTTFDEIPSPNHKPKAVVSGIGSGATTGVNTRVVIVNASCDASAPESLPKGFFVADKSHGQAPAGMTQSSEVRLAWKSSDKKIYLQHHHFAHVLHSENEQKGLPSNTKLLSGQHMDQKESVSTVKIYGIKNCDTMKKAMAWLDGQGIAYEFIDYKKAGVAKARLPDWSCRAGWKTLLNTRGLMWRKLAWQWFWTSAAK